MPRRLLAQKCEKIRIAWNTTTGALHGLHQDRRKAVAMLFEQGARAGDIVIGRENKIERHIDR